MATHKIECPHCGKVGTTSRELLPGKGVRCSGCGESFKIPNPETYDPRVENKPSRANLDVTNEVSDINSRGFGMDLGTDLENMVADPKDRLRSTAPPTTRRSRSRWSLKLLTACALIGLGLGGGFLIWGRPKPSDQNVTDRKLNPYQQASLAWDEPEDEILNTCFSAYKLLDKYDKFVPPVTFATLLITTGIAERGWRGQEKCRGTVFTVALMAEMISEGTSQEDAARMVVKLHRIRLGVRDTVTAEECLESRQEVYRKLKMGAFTSRASAYDQFLKTAHLLSGNENFDYK